VLIITYYWPPAGGPGVQRWLKFVKYLRQYGWEPVVLTVSGGTYPSVDPTLEAEIPEGLTVYKTRANSGPFRWYNLLKGNRSRQVSVALINTAKKPSLFDSLAIFVRSNLFIPDARKGWNKSAMKAVPEILEKHQPALVISSGPPHSTHLTGLKIARQNAIPWIADLRDPWTTVFYNMVMPRTSRTKRIDQKLEDAVISLADAVVVVSEGMKHEFEGRAKRIEVIPNGYDEDDMHRDMIQVEQQYFTLLHTGNLAPSQHVPALWDAIAGIINDNNDFAADFRLKFVGNTDGSIIRYLEEKGLANNVIQQGYVEHREATRLMTEATMVLLVIPRTPGNGSVVTGKVFEYLASGTPVLGVGPVDGDAAAILTDTGRSAMVDFDDEIVIRQRLTEAYTHWLEHGRRLPRHHPGSATRYSRESATYTLTQLMDEVVGEYDVKKNEA
ncbi:MAG: glycosyltransferase family 4 protein, partial [Bacteroidales bacterium]